MSAIPAGLNYEPKPAAIPVYRRRCITNATSSTPYEPLQTIKIPLDTAMHGSVLDTKQTMLQFTVELRNTNPFVDYVNFDRAGANGLISAFRFMVNGNPVEKVTEYAEKYQDMMIKLGLNGDPYHFFQPNPFIPEDGPCHTNFIKPPMVDCMGNTMYRPHMLMDEASAPNVFYGKTSTQSDQTYQTSAPTDTTKESLIATGTPTVNTSFQLTGRGETSMFAYQPAGTFKPESYASSTGTLRMNPMMNINLGFDVQSNVVAQVQTFLGGEPAWEELPTTNPRATQDFWYQKEVDFCDGILAQKRIVLPSTEAGKVSYSVHTPAEWPYFIPKIKPPRTYHSEKRLQDVTRYYSNCKSIPVGMRSDLSANDYLYDTSAFTADSTTIKTLQLNVVIPLLSGILGLGADKMFPDMLIAPGKAWLEFDLQDFRKAFYVTMDPCRRVPGTIRDYVPYTGTAYGAHRFPTATSVTHHSSVNNFLGVDRMLPLYHDGPRVLPRDQWGAFLPAPNIYAAEQMVGLSLEQRKTAVGIKDLYTICYNANACKGIHFMVHPCNESFTNEMDTANGIGAVLNRKTSVETPYRGSLPISSLAGATTATVDTTFPAGVYYNGGGSGVTYIGTYPTALRLVRKALDGGTHALGNSDDYNQAPTGTLKQYQRIPVDNISNVGGIPIPQYVPVLTPWIVKSGLENTYYCTESESCYGTYLKQAVAQSSRTVMSSMNNPTPGISFSTYFTSYRVSNVELITEQILLPDAVTSQVLDGASAGAITYHTTFIGSVIQQAVESVTQNQILTVTGASVNNLTLLFRSGAQTSGDLDSQAYNSLSFYNPFASVTYDATLGAGKYDVGGKYTIANSLSSQKGSNFNLQLKIGNEFIPRTPITNLATLLMENEKGVQTIADYTSKLPYHCPMINTTNGNANVDSFMDYAVLEDGFLAAFIPLDALDDQTITGNPFFAVVDHDTKNSRYQTSTSVLKKTAGTRCQVPNSVENVASGENKVGSTYTGTLNKFVPLDGTFHMCFNLDTFVLEGGSARCGTTIVNNQLFLQCQGMHFMTHKIKNNAPKVDILAIWQQDAKIVFEAGGNCISYI
jgi:hypothetical protein